MQAFDDLKSAVLELISTATDTIQKLVDDAAAKARAYAEATSGNIPTPQMSLPKAGSADFIAQVQDLQSRVREATERLRTSAEAALGNPALSQAQVGEPQGSVAPRPTVEPDSFKAAG